MRKSFELAAGSVIGTHHQALLRNNQDKFYKYNVPGETVAIVADGCGSTPHAEVGAYLGIKMLMCSMSTLWTQENFSVRKALDMTVEGLESLVFGPLRVEHVADSLLFTLVGMVERCGITTFFCIGDGVIIVNGSVLRFESPDNAPRYLGYIIDRNATFDGLKPFICSIPTSEVESFLVGTDGVADLIDNSDTYLPSKTTKMGDISQFWTDDRYYSNPEITNRLLHVANTPKVRFDPVTGDRTNFPGILPDDTTLIAGRRLQIREED